MCQHPRQRPRLREFPSGPLATTSASKRMATRPCTGIALVLVATQEEADPGDTMRSGAFAWSQCRWRMMQRSQGSLLPGGCCLLRRVRRTQARGERARLAQVRAIVSRSRADPLASASRYATRNEPECEMRLGRGFSSEQWRHPNPAAKGLCKCASRSCLNAPEALLTQALQQKTLAAGGVFAAWSRLGPLGSHMP